MGEEESTVDFEKLTITGLRDIQKAVGKLHDQFDDLKKAVTTKAEDPPKPAPTIEDISKAVGEYTGGLKSSVEEMLKAFIGDLKKESAAEPKVDPVGQGKNLAKESATEPPVEPIGQKKDLAKQEPSVDECMEAMRSGKPMSEECKQKLADTKKALDEMTKGKAEDKELEQETEEEKRAKLEKQAKVPEEPPKKKVDEEVLEPPKEPDKKIPPEDAVKAEEIAKAGLDDKHLKEMSWREACELIEPLKKRHR